MYKRYERNKQGKKKQAYTKGTKRKQAQKGLWEDIPHTCYTTRSLSWDLWNVFHSSHTVQHLVKSNHLLMIMRMRVCFCLYLYLCSIKSGTVCIEWSDHLPREWCSTPVTRRSSICPYHHHCCWNLREFSLLNKLRAHFFSFFGVYLNFRCKSQSFLKNINKALPWLCLASDLHSASSLFALFAQLLKDYTYTNS